MNIAASMAYFIVAGLCEIGVILIWLWLREGKSLWLGVLGGGIRRSTGSSPPSNLRTLDESMLLMVESSSCLHCCGDGRWMVL